MLKGFLIHELQADEIRTFIGSKKRVIWVLTTLEVWSRLWVSLVVGYRNFRHIQRVILSSLQRGLIQHRFLFTTDGFEMYEWAAKRLLVGVCIPVNWYYVKGISPPPFKMINCSLFTPPRPGCFLTSWTPSWLPSLPGRLKKSEPPPIRFSGTMSQLILISSPQLGA